MYGSGCYTTGKMLPGPLSSSGVFYCDRKGKIALESAEQMHHMHPSTEHFLYEEGPEFLGLFSLGGGD